MAKKVALGFIIAVGILGMVAGGSIWFNAEVTHNSCEGVNDLRGVLTQILNRSKGLAQENEEYTTAEKELANEFYTQALTELEPTKC